jgi:hypothetical protein
MKGHKKYISIVMRIFMLNKSRMTKKKPKTPVHGGAVKANQLFADRGKQAIYSMLKPKTPQKYISFN